jgi:hypothetical protein
VFLINEIFSQIIISFFVNMFGCHKGVNFLRLIVSENSLINVSYSKGNSVLILGIQHSWLKFFKMSHCFGNKQLAF